MNFLSQMNFYQWIMFYAAVFFLVYGGFDCIHLFFRIFRQLRRRKRLGNIWIYLVRKNYRRILKLVVIFLFVIFLCRQILGTEKTEKVVSNIGTVNNVEENLWENNKDILVRLKEENFAVLSREEKAEALQGIVDLEMVYYGIDAVPLKVEILDEDVRGSYDHESRVITVNQNILDLTTEEILEVVLHECYHAYQCACIEEVDWEHVNVELRLYKDILQWKEDLNSYVGAKMVSESNEYTEYYNQSCEQDARDYAREWAYWYMLFIGGIEEWQE